MLHGAYGEVVKAWVLFWKGQVQQVSLDRDELVKTWRRLEDGGFLSDDFQIRQLVADDLK